jgi:DNA-binding NarL/FixJ family response regulator
MRNGALSSPEDRPAVLEPHPLFADDPSGDLLSPEDWVRVGEHVHLTPRELSVAVLIFEGKTRYQIARRLGCAQGTVRVYIDRLFAKLNVHDRVGIVLRVMRVHLAITNA